MVNDMSRKNQIDEMARTMCFRSGHCTVESCVGVNCETTWLVTKLYNAGYRKQTEGEWLDRKGKSVKFNENDGCPEKSCYCSVCEEWLVASDEYPCIGNYCPNCGAKMKGDE